MKEEILKEITQASAIIVAGHIDPDGDDVSSVSSMVMGLEKLGKRAIGVIDSQIPDYLKNFQFVNDKIREMSCVEKDPADLLIIVDASSPDRVGKVQQLFSYRRVVVIDHHATNLSFGHVNWVDASYASCAQMVLEVLTSLGVEYDKELATANLLGIATDTGFFKYSNVNEKVFNDCAFLLSKKAELSYITNMILENVPLESKLLLKDVLNEMKLVNDNTLAYVAIPREMSTRYGFDPVNVPPFVSELRSIKGVEVAVTFIEYEKNDWHVSLRSKSYVDVSQVALKYGGGGHVRAAGFSLQTGDIKSEIRAIIENIISFMKTR
ncbi:MAG TPA: bifunctional oligoribonuclease/PAP phosphatase NrnA [Petrotogaceae bacterium]|jgi:phosphoesterase RecJ-like protein|nr:bifunctional oligoribonuclease/PAP phosphatase NrnA [Petrotogaceae bacterium]HPG48062.1 bifunctional oligoribonuclease/PAP phosphatase NrnA [Petrotogaceae bacterium]HPO26264.1 bifunctional oligoribonuclease/PAP phosphatase NrnA [Petrotogaceae bacterium]